MTLDMFENQTRNEVVQAAAIRLDCLYRTAIHTNSECKSDFFHAGSIRISNNYDSLTLAEMKEVEQYADHLHDLLALNFPSRYKAFKGMHSAEDWILEGH